MSATRITRCSACGARVVWRRTAANRPIPLDVAPVADGNVILLDGVAIVLRTADVVAAETVRYVSHFTTCPDAGQFRRSRRAGP